MKKKPLNITITIIIQIIIGHILAFTGTFVAGVGNGWELIFIPFWYSVGVWITGVVSLKKYFKKKHYFLTIIGTIIGSILGVVLILITPPIGFIQFFFPLIGALAGFYFFLRKNIL